MKFRRVLFLLGVAAGIASGCDSGLVRHELRGTPMEPAIAKPTFTWPTADGRQYDFRKETDGDLALIFFGYTHCPDICPVHMSNIAAVLNRMSGTDARRVHVLFVTTDPARDTDERLREWLGAIDKRIVGLRPSVDEAIRVQSELGIQPAMLSVPKPGHEGNYDVGHGAHVIAFAPDNLGHSAYAAGTRQTDWANDIPILLRMKPAAGQ